MSRHGYALVYAFLLLLALSMVGMGIMALGMREKMIAAAVHRRAQAGSLARAGVAEALRDWSTRRYTRLAVGEATAAAAPPGVQTEIARLDTALYLVRSTWDGAPDGPPPHHAEGRAAVLVRSLDPARLASRFPAAVTAASAALHRGMISGLDRCGRDGTALQVPSPEIGPAAVLTGDPPVRLLPMPPALEPDPLEVLGPGPHLAAEPRPLASAGRCEPDARNWGSPDPAHPCYRLLPFIRLAGPAHLTSGTGRGVLVVRGDLELSGDFSFAGVISVTGRLTVADAVDIRGAVRAGHLELEGGSITRSRCDLDAALSGPALDQPFRPSGRWWIPAF